VVLVEAGGILTRDDGSSVFQVSIASLAAPLAFVAGDPLAHRQALADIARARVAIAVA
jgi:hypothetical protein